MNMLTQHDFSKPLPDLQWVQSLTYILAPSLSSLMFKELAHCPQHLLLPALLLLPAASTPACTPAHWRASGRLLLASPSSISVGLCGHRPSFLCSLPPATLVSEWPSVSCCPQWGAFPQILIIIFWVHVIPQLFPCSCLPCWAPNVTYSYL